MDAVLAKVKAKNNETLKKGRLVLLKIGGAMVLLAIVLLIIDNDQFLTPAVLLIFFAFVLLIISLFLIALKAANNQNTMIKNSVDIVYQNYMKALNNEENQTYFFETDQYEDKPWYLLPSYAQKDINYCLCDEDENIRLYHGQAYTAAGNPPRRTIYLNGLYIILKDIKGDIQYRDQESFSGKIIQSLKGVYGKDIHDVDQYIRKTRYNSGTFYSHSEEEVHEVIKKLISTLRKMSFIQRFSVAIKEGELHVAIEQKTIRLPYVRKYTEIELNEIKRVLDENVALVNEIKDVVSINESYMV